MSKRPKLLFLSQTLPYPLDFGQAVRTYHVLRLLAQSFDVTTLCFYRRKPGAGASDLAEGLTALNALAPTEAFAIPQEHSRARLAWDHLRSFAAHRVYTRFAYDSRAFHRRLAQLLRSGFDLVHVDSLDLAGYLPRLRGLPTICAHNNVESALLRRRAEIERGWRRAYVGLQARLYEAEEQRWCPALALNAAVSEEDARGLRAIAPGSRVIVVPNGVDLDYFQPAPGNGAAIAFLGGSNWFPNKDAMNWFGEAMLPLLRAGGVSAPVRWIGRCTAEEQAGYAARFGFELTGWVSDVRPHLARAACLVVPLRVGGGTRLKILDAWAMGIPIVSTSIGCEGLAARDGVNILVRDEPAAFADAVAEVLGDPELRRRLGAGARATVEAHYGWDAIGRGMVAAYRALLPR